MAEMDSEVTVTLKLTEKDFARFYWSTSRLGFLFRQGILIATVQLLLYSLLLISGPGPGWKVWLSVVVFMQLLSFVFLIYVPWLLLIRKAYLNSPTARAETTYRFTAQGVSSSHPNLHVEVPWEGIGEVRETKTDFIFFVSAGSVVLLPKTAISSEVEQETLRRLLKTAVGDRAKLLSDLTA